MYINIPKPLAVAHNAYFFEILNSCFVIYFQLYKLSEAELSTGTLLDAVVCKMALKDVS